MKRIIHNRKKRKKSRGQNHLILMMIKAKIQRANLSLTNRLLKNNNNINRQAKKFSNNLSYQQIENRKVNLLTQEAHLIEIVHLNINNSNNNRTSILIYRDTNLSEMKMKFITPRIAAILLQICYKKKGYRM